MSSGSWRLFVALSLPETVRERLAREARTLVAAQTEWRFVPVANAHLTLRFLGATDGQRAPRLIEGLETSLGGAPSLALRLGEWGAFPSPARPRVLWRGISGDAPELAGLAKRVEGWARSEGFEPETRAFRAHVTVARARGPRARLQLPREGASTEDAAGGFVADVVTLYRSHLGGGPPRYEALAGVPLVARSGDS